MTSERLGEMFEGANANMCANKIPLVLTVGQSDLSSVCRRGAQTPIGAGIFFH